MASLGLGDMARSRSSSHRTGATSPPASSCWRSSARFDGDRLTKVGRRLARLPIDPRLARMVLEAERLGCVREVIVIAAALSLQDPRERPAELKAQADQQHARFKAEGSDFLTWLNLWRYVKEQQRELSSSAFRRMCKREFLNWLRVREWQDFESQLRQVCKEMKIKLGQPADAADWATPTASTRPCWPGCCRTSAFSRSAIARTRLDPGEDHASTSAPAGRASRSSRAADCTGRTRSS